MQINKRYYEENIAEKDTHKFDLPHELKKSLDIISDVNLELMISSS